jgi:hypothetical protein
MRPPRAALLAACLGFAAAAVLAADDRTIFIELDARSGALPNAVNASGTVVGKFDDGGSFYWMPTTGVIDLGGGFGTGISADGNTIVGGSPPAPGITNAAIWQRGTEWRLLGSFPGAVPATSCRARPTASAATAAWWSAARTTTAAASAPSGGSNRRAWPTSAAAWRAGPAARTPSPETGGWWSATRSCRAASARARAGWTAGRS